MLDIKSDLKAAVDKYKDMLDTQELNKAVSMALNKVVKQVGVDSSQAVRNVYNISPDAMEKKIKYSRSTKNKLTSKLFVRGERLGVIDFGAEQNSKGITVVFKNSSEEYVHAFVAKMKSGHTGVFFRKKGTEMKSNKNKEKIVEDDTLSLAYSFTNDHVEDVTYETMSTHLPIELEKAMTRVLKAKRKNALK